MAAGIGKRVLLLRIALLIALCILGVIILIALFYLALPLPKYELIGSTSEYPASSIPYDLRATARFYLVNTGNEILAIDPRAPRKAGCWVSWHAEKRQFRDGCFGTGFDLKGSYVFGPPSDPLNRYPVRIEDHNVWVSTNSIVDTDADQK